MARSPVSPSSPPSLMCAAISLACSSVAGGASSTLKATSGGRAADQHRARRSDGGCGGPKSGVSSPASMRRWSSAGPPRLSSRACATAGEDPVEEDGELELAWPSVSASTSASATGSAPVLLAEVDDRRDVDGADAGVDPLVGVDAGRRTPLVPRRRPGRAHRARPRACRRCGGGRCRSGRRAARRPKAAADPIDRGRSRPSETFG